MDIVWPTTGTPNSAEASEDRCFRMIGSQSATPVLWMVETSMGLLGQLIRSYDSPFGCSSPNRQSEPRPSGVRPEGAEVGEN